MDVAAALQVRASMDGVSQTTRALTELAGAADSAERAADGLSPAAREAATETRGMGDEAKRASASQHALASSLGTLLGRIVAIGGAYIGLRQIITRADDWSDMSSRVGIAVGDMELAAGTMEELGRIARASYSSIQQTTEAFAANSVPLRDLGYATQEMLDYTEALNNALVITATRGDRAASVQNALSRAMATGTLSGTGLDTVLSNGGRVAQALADELGTTVSGLRELASEGAITGEVIASALINRVGELREQAALMPATVSDGFTLLSNSVTAAIGTLDKASGATSALAELIIAFADGITTHVVPALLAVGKHLGEVIAFFAGLPEPVQDAAAAIGIALGVGGPILLAVGVMAKAFGALVLTTGPIGLFITAAATIYGVWAIWGEDIKRVVGGALDWVGEKFTMISERISDFIAELGAARDAISNYFGAGILDTPFPNALAPVEPGRLPMVEQVPGGLGGLSPDAMGALGIGRGLGQGIGEGLAAGLGETQGETLDAVRAYLDRVQQEARDALEIRSPSRVFARIGHDLGDGLIVGVAESGMAEHVRAQVEEVVENAAQVVEGLSQTIGQGLAGAFTDAIMGAKSLGDALKDLLQQLARMFLNRAFMQLWGGGGGIGGGGIAGLFGLTPNASGGVYSGPGISAHSSTVVSAPTLFPFARGIGLMGEAGPEAILPLKRGSDGKLGVSAGAGGTVVQVNNYSGQPTREERSTMPDGRELVKIMVGEVRQDIGRGGMDGAFKRFGAAPMRTVRG
jgi:tape measure domain-containing protein